MKKMFCWTILVMSMGCATTAPVQLFGDAAAPLSAGWEAESLPVGPTLRQTARSFAAAELTRIATAKKGDAVTLALFPDATFRATTEFTSREGEVVSWRGRIASAKFWGTATLAIGPQGTFGTVQVDDRIFALRPANGTTVVSEIAQDRFPREAPPRRHPSATSAPPASRDASNLSLLVVFPGRSICSSLGSVVWIAAISGNLNGVFSSAADSTVLSKVSLFCPDYTPKGGNLEADLTWLENDPDVAAQRQSTQSDLVTMVVPAADFCGLGYENVPVTAADAPFAFSVVRADCALENFTLAHEIGHNLGMEHDRFELGGGVADQCNYGFTVQIAGLPVGYTVMAYNNFCVSQGVVGCKRMGVYSNLNRTFGFVYGVPCSVQTTGVDGSANNAAQLRIAAPIAAGWQ